MKLRNALITAAGLIALAAPAFSQNTGLKRLTAREDLLGWEAVGRIDIADTGFCTGVLIASDLVLTAGHCLVDAESGARRDVADITFRAGLRDGVAIAERGVAQALLHANYDPLANGEAQNIRYDAALLKLAEPIPTAVASPFLIRQSARVSDEVSIVSYAAGRAEASSRQRVCGVLGRSDGLLAFDCDVYFGSSGAPVFDRSGGRARIVSIISAGSRSDTGTISFGMELAGAVDDLKRAMRSGVGVWPEAVTGARRIGLDAPRAETGALFLKP